MFFLIDILIEIQKMSVKQNTPNSYKISSIHHQTISKQNKILQDNVLPQNLDYNRFFKTLLKQIKEQNIIANLNNKMLPQLPDLEVKYIDNYYMYIRCGQYYQFTLRLCQQLQLKTQPLCFENTTPKNSIQQSEGGSKLYHPQNGLSHSNPESNEKMEKNSINIKNERSTGNRLMQRPNDDSNKSSQQSILSSSSKKTKTGQKLKISKKQWSKAKRRRIGKYGRRLMRFKPQVNESHQGNSAQQQV